MEKEKAPDGRDVLTIRMPTDLNRTTKKEAERIGIPQNAFLMLLISYGLKVHNAKCNINLDN